MGTHPIFESDFDCLTEKMATDYMRSMLSELMGSQDNDGDEKSKFV